MSNIITLDNIRNNKHKAIIRNISDIFDENRGKIDENIALTVFKDINSNHKILFNTLSPDLNGKQLVKIGSNGLIFSRAEIETILCSDPINNDSIGLLKDPHNKIIYEAQSDTNKLRFLIKLSDPQSDIAGISIGFADSTTQGYKISIYCVNEDNQFVSEVQDIVVSAETNMNQFFQLRTIAQEVNRIMVDIEVPEDSQYKWQMRTLQVYSHLDEKALSLLKDMGMVEWQSLGNPILTKKLKDDLRTLNAAAGGDTGVPEVFLDPYGTPIPVNPDFNKIFFDYVPDPVRPYAITPLVNGKGDIKVYESNKDTTNLTFSFTPAQQINRYPDEAVISFPKLVEKGYIKEGGFKNYCVTFYVRLDGITMTGQYLMWKYGGWMFNSQFIDMARATDIAIPIGDNSEENKPKVFEEYKFGDLKDLTSRVNYLDPEPLFLEEHKWIGIQIIREVIDKNSCIVTLRINRNPITEDQKLSPSGFKDYMMFNDVTTSDGHQANTWGGIHEILSITGSRYVNIYGFSLYEFDPKSHKS